LIRNPQGQVARQINTIDESQIVTSVIVAAELRYGAAKKGSKRLSERVEAVLGALEILAFEPPSDSAYALIRTKLEQIGQPIGGNDLLIAAQAFALGCTVVTDNISEFSRIDGLACINWLR
jgi:tRNA(fMet)-specific endonuclease VapC